MVIVRLTGGLGNQMFQYAAGRALADRLGAELLLDTRAFERALAFKAYTRRSYALAPFKLRARLATAADLKNWPLWVVEIGLRLRFVRPLFRRWHFESAITYDPGVLALREPVCLVGYWQSERYFIDIADRIRADFTLQQPLAGANAGLLELAHSAGSVGLHVRRGDLVSLNSAAQASGLCSVDYYRRAIDLVRNRCPECRFLVFSDDPEWARAELPLRNSLWLGSFAPDELDVLSRELRPRVDVNALHDVAGADVHVAGATLNGLGEELAQLLDLRRAAAGAEIWTLRLRAGFRTEVRQRRRI